MAETAPNALQSYCTMPGVFAGNEQVSRTMYTSLASWETRLLAVHPGDENDELIADLQVSVMTYQNGLGIVSEDRNVTYEALSYTWGDPILSEYLICSGNLFGITKNLAEALRHLRTKSGIRYIWVDAICINQFDRDEKARQIRNLFLIFKKARTVIVWLGHAGRYTDKAISWAKEARTYSKEERLESPESLESVSEIQARLYERDNGIIGGIVDLICRPWSRRAWIVQELHAASSVSIHCGPSSMEWEEYFFIAETIRTHEYFLGFEDIDIGAQPGFATNVPIPMTTLRSHRALLAVASIEYLNAIRTSDVETRFKQRPYDPIPDSTRLVFLLEESTHLRATDDRDRIIALLALTTVPITYGPYKGSQCQGVHVNYGLSTSQLYQDVAKYIMNCQRNVEVIYLRRPDMYLADHADIHLISGLPSWTPDWRIIQEGLLRYDGEFAEYVEQDRTELYILRLLGYVLGEVSVTNNIFRSIVQCRYKKRDRYVDLYSKSTIKIGYFQSICRRIVDLTRIPQEFRSVNDLSQILPGQETSVSGSEYYEVTWKISGRSRAGDILISANGAYLPLVLRKCEGTSAYTYVGFAKITFDHEPWRSYSDDTYRWLWEEVRSTAGNSGISASRFEIR